VTPLRLVPTSWAGRVVLVLQTVRGRLLPVIQLLLASRRRGGAVRRAFALWTFSIGLILTAALVDVLVLGAHTAFLPVKGIDWWVLAIVFAASELFVVEFTLGANTHSFTLSELPLVIGLFVLAPSDLALAQLVGAGTAMVLTGTRSPLRMAFNVGNMMMGTTAAILVFDGLIGLGNDPLGPAGWFAGFSAAFVSDTAATLLVLSAISISDGRPTRIPRLVSLGTLYTLADTSLAIVSVIVLQEQPRAAWLLAVLAGVFFFGYRAYGEMRHRHANLELLQRATRSIQQALQVERVAEAVLVTAREMFSAVTVEVHLLPGAAEPGRIASLGEDDIVRWARLEAPPAEPEWDRLVAGQALRLRPADARRVLGSASAIGEMEALAAGLVQDGEIQGAIVVATSGPGSWRPDQLTLLETLANHANVAIHNSHLVDRLSRQARSHEHDATHDGLTGLANRVLFRKKLSEAVEAAGTSRFAIMTLDLDRFKEVNDTLGHHNGDELLRQIAARLSAALADSSCLARLSGDEFAVLLGDVESVEEAVVYATRLAEALRPAFQIQEMQLDAEASVGIAIYPDHGTDADTLLQRADVAMYTAKTAHTGFEIYDPERDQNTPTRLALMGELRSAIELQQLGIHYQPQLDVRTRLTGAVEALVRWSHPRHGLISAGKFVPLAEQTGLIRPLTLFVLEQVIRQSRSWRERGTPVNVSVNLSVRNLLDVTLPSEIDGLLTRYGVPASTLTLEITETALMSDPARAEAVLARLHELGTPISIDDFGTGYASLSYLKHFPVSELKIDQAFVQGIARDRSDLHIVQSTISLAHSLGLRVVAEGSETPDVTSKLVSLGCDAIQGFDVAVPMSAARITARLLAEQETHQRAEEARRLRQAAAFVGRPGFAGELIRSGVPTRAIGE
jgi:diguanylate cyclase (GGDEF)-like protein